MRIARLTLICLSCQGFAAFFETGNDRVDFCFQLFLAGGGVRHCQLAEEVTAVVAAQQSTCAALVLAQLVFRRAPALLIGGRTVLFPAARRGGTTHVQAGVAAKDRQNPVYRIVTRQGDSVGVTTPINAITHAT